MQREGQGDTRDARRYGVLITQCRGKVVPGGACQHGQDEQGLGKTTIFHGEADHHREVDQK